MSSLPPGLETFVNFTRRLDEADVEYMISGSVAAMLYGQPRLTTDIDVIAVIDLRAAINLAKMFPASDFYFPPVDVITIEIARETRGHFNILHIESGFKADVYLSGIDPLRRWALTKVRNVEIAGHVLRLAPPEYVIVRKLEFYREGRSEKHLRDIRSMLDNSGDRIDLDLLMKFVSERNLQQEWEKAKAAPL